MDADKIKDVVVIVRSAHERTEALCRHLFCQQVPEDRVVVIHEKPFSAALARSFEIGLSFKLPWTLCVDADVLIAPDTVRILLEEMARHEEAVFGVHGMFLDKFYARPKGRGLHLYRTRHLEQAVKIVHACRNQIRPETAVKDMMTAKGRDWIECGLCCGLHDHEQYYVDIFRKTATRAQKSPSDYDALLAIALSRAKTAKD